jgi:NitT/TauT family transport system ATP-binding protein
VDTPKNEVYLTELGRRFLGSDHKGRTAIFAEQVQKLRLFHIILEHLKVEEEVEADKILKEISMALPYDNPEKVLHTMIAWGRYAGLMDYNANTATIFIPKDEEPGEA